EHLDGIQSGALSQIITHYPERQATRMRWILANAADIHRIVARHRQRSRILRMPRIVYHNDALSAAQDLARIVGGQGPLELDVDGFRMPNRHRHAYACGADRELRC